MAGEIFKQIDEMTKTYLNNIMQLLMFQFNDGTWYGINVSKVRSIEDFSKYKVIRNVAEENVCTRIFSGYVNYHDSVIPYLNAEEWLGIYTPESVFRALLVVEFNQSTIALGILNFERIHNVPIENLQTTHYNNDFVTYSTLLEVNGKKETCLVLDVEKLLFDVFGMKKAVSEAERTEVESTKTILIAEDSKSARQICTEIMKNTDIPYQMFENGQAILEYLKNSSEEQVQDIGLIITDLEMPLVDGYQVLSFVKNDARFKHIPVFVNTSMSDLGVRTKVQQLGAAGFVAKTDPQRFIQQIREHMLC